MLLRKEFIDSLSLFFPSLVCGANVSWQSRSLTPITDWKASALCLSGAAGLDSRSTVLSQPSSPSSWNSLFPYSCGSGEAFYTQSHCVQLSVPLHAGKGTCLDVSEGRRKEHTIHFLNLSRSSPSKS